MADFLHALRWRRRRLDPAKDPSASQSEPPEDDSGQSSVSALAAGMTAHVEAARERLEAQRPTNRAVDAVFRWVQLQTETGGALLAGAIAFRIFLFLLPCVFAVVVGLGIGADLEHADPRQVARSFGMAGLAATAVESAATSSVATRWVTFLLAMFALVLGARNLLGAFVITHALIWRVPPRTVRHLTTAGIGLIGVFLAASLLLRLVYRTQDAPLAVRILALVLFTAVPAGIWLTSSLTFFPRPEGTTWRDLLPGSLLFGVGVGVLHVATVVWFAPYLDAKSQTYGAIGAAVAILVWAYLLGRVATAAPTLNAVLWRTSSRRVGPPAG